MNFFQAVVVELNKPSHPRLKAASQMLWKYAKRLISSITIGSRGVEADLGELFKDNKGELSTIDLKQCRQETDELLRESETRIVVFMDDIDRLTKSEIQTLFKLLKLIADFPYMVYVLALDIDMVARALQERYTSSAEEEAEGKNSGRVFLEKLIQVPVQLPAPNKLTMCRLALDGVYQITKAVDIWLSEEERTRSRVPS